MNRYFYLFTICISVVFAKDPTSYYQNSLYIDDVVNPLSGSVCLSQKDLVVKGAQDIVIYRHYLSPYIPAFNDQPKDINAINLRNHLVSHYRGWTILPHLYLKVLSQENIHIVEPSGHVLAFVKKGSSFFKPLSSSQKEPNPIYSSQHNPKNIRVEAQPNLYIIHFPDGYVRHYVNKKINIDSSFYYLLDKEILPNGKVLKYTYDKERLVSIESKDPKERYTYASVHFEASSGWNRFTKITSSTGQTVIYDYETRTPNKKVDNLGLAYPPLLTKSSSPFYRNGKSLHNDNFLLYSSDDINHCFSCSYSLIDDGETPHYKINKLRLPFGYSFDYLSSIFDGFNTIYYFSYEFNPDGLNKTIVTHYDGSRVEYLYTHSYLLQSINYYDDTESLRRTTSYTWTDEGYIASLTESDPEKIYYVKNYEYDQFGNPEKETLTGNLTGEGETTRTISKVFSSDGRNLLLIEEDDERVGIIYSYLPNTNLRLSKLSFGPAGIYRRVFYKYDDCNNLIEKIFDDGSSKDRYELTGVTQRTIKTFIRRKQAPFLHMPEWIEERYLDSSVEKLMSKARIHYDKDGNIAQKDIYDANGKLSYSLYYEYNERGDCLSETNAIGQKMTCSYDAKGRKIASTNFSQRMHTQRHYDARGRLIKTQENGSDGIEHITSYAYDYHDLLTSKTNHYGQTTAYENDPIAKKATKITYPHHISEYWFPPDVIVKKSYDALGRKLSKTDANGNVTLYQRNVYGSPIIITYPDGSAEHFLYYKNGLLKEHTDRKSLSTHYTYDPQNRTTKKVYYSKDKTFLAEELYEYSGYHLIKKTDKEGIVTTYTYDKEGKKIKKQKAFKVFEYAYNALGMLITKTKLNDKKTLVIHYKKDLLDRKTEITKTDTSGKLLHKITYQYDADGHRSTVIKYIHDKPCKETYVYDSFRRMTEQCDALGHKTFFIYDESAKNPIGQTALKVTIVDSSNASTVLTTDAYGKVVVQEVLNSYRWPISSIEYFYDPVGNLTLKKEDIYQEDTYLKTLSTQYSYNNQNLLHTIKRAYGSDDERTTLYTYTPNGQVATKTLPDKTVLTYNYDLFGNKTEILSSDKSIHLQYKYNLLGQLTKAYDKKNKITLTRALNSFGNILKEICSNGLVLEKTYDVANRPTHMQLARQRKIFYTYDPLYLRSIQSEALLHKFVTYDLAGNLLTENLSYNLGTISYQYDKTGRLLTTASPYYYQISKYDKAGHLIKTDVDKLVTYYTHDCLGQVIKERTKEHTKTYEVDSRHKLTKKDSGILYYNDLGELLSYKNTKCKYDLRGNLITKTIKSADKNIKNIVWHYTYDALNRLIKAQNQQYDICFTYDPLGRKIEKTCLIRTKTGWKKFQNRYLYDGQQEIASFTKENTVKEMRILGRPLYPNVNQTLAIEVKKILYPCICDHSNSIRRIIDRSEPETIEVIVYDYTPFGEKSSISSLSPWGYTSKRLDEESGLIDYGDRFYDPHTTSWLTIDPLHE